MKDNTKQQDKYLAQLNNFSGQLDQLIAMHRCDLTENASTESEDLLKCLFERSLAGIYIIQDGKFIYVNSKFAKIFGYTKDEILNLKSVTALASAEAHSIIESNIKKRINGEMKSIINSFPGLCKDGSTVICKTLGTRTSYAGRPAIIGTLLDITKNKKLEKMLLQNQTRLRLMNSITSGIRNRLSLDERIKRILKAVKSNFKNDVLSYAIIDSKTCLKVNCIIGPNAPSSIFEYQEKIAISSDYGKRLNKDKPIIVEDITVEKYYTVFKKLIPGFPIKSMLQVPVKYSDQINGVLSLFSNEKHKWDSLEIEIFSEIAEYLSIAIKDANVQQMRKHAVEKLRKREERLRKIIHNMPVMVNVFGPDGNIVVWNRECERVSGYSADEIVNNQKALETVYPNKDYRRKILQEWAERGSDCRDWEWQLTAKDGKVKTVAWSSIAKRFPIPGWGSWGIGVDITERKQAEEALRESEDKYRSLFENSRDPIFIISKEGFVLDANFAFQRLFDCCEDETRHLNIKKIFGAQEAFTDIAEEIKAKGAIKDLELKFVNKKGKEIIGLLSASERKNAAGQVVGYQGILHDITERKIADDARRESEEKYKVVVENANDAILVLFNAKIEFFNSKALELTGYDHDELKAKKFIELVHWEDKKDIIECFKKMQKMQQASVESFRMIDKHGDIKWIDGSSVAINWGKTPANLFFLNDITKRKTLQEELARAQRLESAGRIAGQIAHDFNNLLSPLAAYPTLIREELAENNDAVFEMLEEIEKSANKLGQINQQLLALGRRGHYTMEKIDLNELIHNILTSQNLMQSIILKEEFSPGLCNIKGGVAQLTRAFMNLICNAVEAMNGSGVLTIRTKNIEIKKDAADEFQSVKPGDYVNLQISDNGAGISPEILPNIFDPFFTTKKLDKKRGSGLGLSIVHGIIEDHNAFIKVDTQIDQGTTFSLFFPAEKIVHKDKRKYAETHVSGHEKILVVDDDPIQRKVAGQLLKRLGYEVDVLSSGERAVSHVKKNSYDLVIMDMVMEGIDGVETYKRILEFQPDQKAIILSGYAMSNRVQQALKLGAGTFVTKPVTQKILAEAVRKELDKKNMRKPGLN